MDTGSRRLALIECGERDARTVRAVDVHAWPLTLGRALDNDLVLDDPCVAPHHARIDADADGGLRVTALPGLNGLRLGREHLAPGHSRPLPAGGATLLLGHSRLRLRLPGEALAPERPLPPRRGGAWLPWAAGAALLALQTAQQWLALDPGADLSMWLPTLLGLPLALAAWCGLWALLAKLFQHRFDFAGHARIALPGLFGVGLFEALWPQASAAIDAPTLWQLGPPLQALLLAGVVWAHLRHLLPAHPRAVGATVLSLVLGGGALTLAATERSSDRWHDAPYMSTLPLPAWRLGGTEPPQALVARMAPLAQRLAERAAQARRDEAAGRAADAGDEE